MREVVRDIMPYLLLALMAFTGYIMWNTSRMTRGIGTAFGKDRPPLDFDELRRQTEQRTEEARQTQAQILEELRKHNELLSRQLEIQSRLVERLDALLPQPPASA